MINANEVSIIMEKCAKILALYEDTPIIQALDNIYSACKKEISQNKKSKTEKKSKLNYDLVINDEFINSLYKMNSTNLPDIFDSVDELKTKDGLLFLANKLSLDTSKRSTIDNLKHYILSYFERLRMDDTLKNDRKK